MWYDARMVNVMDQGLIAVLLVVLLAVAQFGHLSTQSGYLSNTSTGTVEVSLIIPPKSTEMTEEAADDLLKDVPHEKVIEVDENGNTTVIYIFE